MSTFFVDPTTAAALWIVVKASVLIGTTVIAQVLLRRRASAAIRHLDVARNRRLPALRVRLASAAIASALLLPLAAARPTLVAAEMDAVPAPARMAPSAARPQNSASAPHLEPVEEMLREGAAVMARAAEAAIGTVQDQLPGTWEIRPTSTEGTVHLRLVEVNSSSGSNIPIDRLEGLTAAQLKGAGGPVQFGLR